MSPPQHRSIAVLPFSGSQSWSRLRAVRGQSPWAQSVVGAAASLRSMMCTCCTAPVTVALRRGGMPLAPSVAYWLGNPLLNPAVLVFLLLVLPWQYALARVVVGLVVVVGAAALVGRALSWRATLVVTGTVLVGGMLAAAGLTMLA